MEIAPKNWRILYRGSLDSCNYDCPYCPFAKKKNTREELAYDKKYLENFTDWVKGRNENISILLTPWGEGLIRSYYQKAMTTLSHLPQVKKIAIQTNLSCSLDWIQKVDKSAFALWITYHPEEVEFDKFVSKCRILIDWGIEFSIGVVGVKAHFEAIERLKNEISERYIWVNAYKRKQNYYSEAEEKWLTSMDSLFPINNQVYQTKGKACSAGNTSFSINEEGDIAPCHFIKKKLGNIYRDNINEVLAPKLCINSECRCYIGYMNLEELQLEKVYGNRILERVPKEF
jgi:MoaA/NifB/PqqE/SkfB family radical SAM enzyme